MTFYHAERLPAKYRNAAIAAAGNAVYPAIPYQIFLTINEIENKGNNVF